MKTTSNTLHHRKKEDFGKLKLDATVMKKIVNDMDENAGILSPLMHWHLLNSKDKSSDSEQPQRKLVNDYENKFNTEYNNAEKMLDAWIGCTGLSQIKSEDLKRYESLLKKIDILKLMPQIYSNEKNVDYRITDLSTIEEINIIYAYTHSKQNLKILEIGGGYGRLAEACLSVFYGIKYVLVDAVPGSLLYAYEYMRQQFPDKRVGFYYNNDSFDMNLYDVYVMPAWHFAELNNEKYDVTVNISSMQEMGQEHVDYYLNLFNEVTVDGGIIFLNNSRDYVFKGQWNYSSKWLRLLTTNTPRSWTKYFPTEVFIKQGVDSELENLILWGMYEYQVEKEADLLEENRKLKNQLTKSESDCVLKKCNIWARSLIKLFGK